MLKYNIMSLEAVKHVIKILRFILDYRVAYFDFFSGYLSFVSIAVDSAHK
jgi:branched-subunit amino acid transport protein